MTLYLLQRELVKAHKRKAWDTVMEIAKRARAKRLGKNWSYEWKR